MPPRVVEQQKGQDTLAVSRGAELLQQRVEAVQRRLASTGRARGEHHQTRFSTRDQLTCQLVRNRRVAGPDGGAILVVELDEQTGLGYLQELLAVSANLARERHRDRPGLDQGQQQRACVRRVIALESDDAARSGPPFGEDLLPGDAVLQELPVGGFAVVPDDRGLLARLAHLPPQPAWDHHVPPR
jgi:hypothetical protein